MKGKNRCRILKDIRRRIAEENNIEYITTECKYKGDCLGTCPKCEAEVRYLERELERKRSLGYKVSVAGLAAGITLASAGCTPDTSSSLSSSEKSLTGDVVDPSYIETSGVPVTSDDISVTVDVTVDGEMVEIQGDFPPEEASDPGGIEESETVGLLEPEDFSEEELMGEPSEYFSEFSDDEEHPMGAVPVDPSDEPIESETMGEVAE